MWNYILIYCAIILSMGAIAYIFHRKRDEHFECQLQEKELQAKWLESKQAWKPLQKAEDYKLKVDGSFHSAQGTPIPDAKLKPALLQNPDGPNVDGTSNSPQALSVFAFNKSSPECCYGPNGGYSTSSGCVCITPAQEKWFANVGGNRNNGYVGI